MESNTYSPDIQDACEAYNLDLSTASPNEIFEAVVHYDGLLGSYPQIIKRWVKEVYHVDLDKLVYSTIEEE